MKRFSPFFLIVASSSLIQSFVLFRLPDLQLVKYSHAAELLLQGKLHGERILDFSPLYLHLNVLLQQMDALPAVLLWIHIACVALSTGLLFQLLSNHFRLWVAIAGTVAFLLDRSLMVYTRTFEPEALLIFFIVTSTYLVSMQTTRTALVAGICFGLSILTRPNFVPVLLAIPFYYKLNSAGNIWKKRTLLFLAPVLFCIVGIWARNTAIMGHFSPFVMNPGTVFYEGNNPNSWGMSAVYPPLLNQVSTRYTGEPDYHHQLYRDFARRIAGKGLSLSEVNSYWSGKALHFLFDHPGRTLRLAATKILHVFHAFQWHDLVVAYSVEKALQSKGMLNTPFAVVSALCIAGLLVLSAEWKKYLIFYAIFFTQFFLMLLIYVSARQRSAILFLFIFFACASVEYIFVQKKSRLLLIPIVVLSILLHFRTDFMHEEIHLWESIQESNAHLRESYKLRNRGRLEEAAMQSARALALAPGLVDSRRPANLFFGDQGFAASGVHFSRNSDPAQSMDRAILLLETGRIREAEEIFQRLHRSGYNPKRDDYQSSEPLFYLARCAIKNNESRRGMEYLERALHSSPGDPSTLAFLHALTGDSKYEEQLLRYFDEIDASFFLGKAHLETGRPKEAIHYFQYVTRTLPEFRQGFVYLAAAFAEAGLYDEAAAQYRKAIAMNPDPVFFESALLTAFLELVQRNPTTMNLYSYGVVLRQFGHFQEALAEQQKALLLDPENKDIAHEINTLKRVLTGAAKNPSPGESR